MGRARPRYNEKARASSRKPTQKPHPNARNGGIIKENDESPAVPASSDSGDTNAFMIIPRKKQENSDTQSTPQPAVKMTAKKRKRFEKYLEKKLKKDARIEILEQLSKSSWSSDLLKSSKNIGRPQQTMREQLRQAILEEKAGLKVSNDSVPLLVEKEIDEETLKESIASVAPEEKAVEPADKPEMKQKLAAPVIGSALKQTENGPALPLTKRKRKKKKSTIPEASRKRFKQRQGVDSDTSFDSSDSEYDSDKSEEKPRESIATLVEPETIDSGPTALEQAVEAAKNVEVPAPRQEEEDEIKVKLLKASNEGDLHDDHIKPFYVPVKRPAKVQEARSQLPVCGEEQVIMEAICNNTVVIICGETGSGKTTQVPQFLYEAGWSHPDSDTPGMIGVTQPRRVAAVSMANRVAHELGLSSQEVSYQIRYDATTSSSTRIKFMTDGVLLRELAQDFLLSKYSIIIIDEAHERNLNTDILIGVLSRVLKLRLDMSKEDKSIKPLRAVIMSATLRVADFTENTNLFPRVPPVINVDARQYPVSIHFNKVTHADYMGEAFKKVSKIHERLPSGGILVFLTGQNEITHLCKMLREKYPSLPPNASKKQRKEEKKAIELESKKSEVAGDDAAFEDEDADFDDTYQVEEDFDLDEDEDDEVTAAELGFEEDELEDFNNAPLHVLPLYSMLPTEAQLRVFQPPPEGARLCVVATNVAETSLTIPGIRYVVDCGKVKERKYDIESGVHSFEIDWTSKASADQRAGRAGRTQAGHCYRLYSSAVYDHEFPKFSVPEIQRMPLDGVVLTMKAMNIVHVINFPFPTPPPKESLYRAEKLLVDLGAIDKKNKTITKLGADMSYFPVGPRLSKMIMASLKHDCLAYVVLMVAALSVGDIFTADVNRKLLSFKSGDSDVLCSVFAVLAYEEQDGDDEFCQNNYLKLKPMIELRKLRGQLTKIITTKFPQIQLTGDLKLPQPTEKQTTLLRRALLAGYCDSIAIRLDPSEGNMPDGQQKKKLVPYKLLHSDDIVYIHPSSVLFDSDPPAMVTYTELFKSGRTYIKGVTAVEPEWFHLKK